MLTKSDITDAFGILKYALLLKLSLFTKNVA